MSAGRVLHLRCFLEGIEVPISSCAVTAQVGSAASAHLELLDSELLFKLLPRTVVHVFYYDHQDGHNYNPPVYDLGSMKNSTSYKLLFCGEVFSIYHNKSGFGSRTVSVMALDFSNLLDTNYIYQVSYANTDGIIGVGDQAEASFTAGQSIGNNPFDDIVNSPSMVIQHLARKQALSPSHAKRVSKIGGLFAIFELLLGVDRYAMGMNMWLTIHEKRVKFLDMVDADNGETAAKLFGDTVFEEWIQGSLGSQAPSMSFREISHILLSYIYYRFCSIPTASYSAPPKGLTGREKPEVTTSSTENTLDTSLSGYFGSGPWSTSGKLDPELVQLAIAVLDNLREGRNGRNPYPYAKVTSGFRGPNSTVRSSKNSAHGRGLAVDIDTGVWNQSLPGEPSFTYNHLFLSSTVGRPSRTDPGSTNVSFTATQKLSPLPLNEEDVEQLILDGYLSPGSTPGSPKATDGRILRFFLNRPNGIRTSKNDQTDTQRIWAAAAPMFEKALFGNNILNVQQLLCYLMVYPLMLDAPEFKVDLDHWLNIYENSSDYLGYWKKNLLKSGFLSREVFLANNPKSIMYRMAIDNPAMQFLNRWFQKYSGFFGTQVFTKNDFPSNDIPIVFEWVKEYPAYYDRSVDKNTIRSINRKTYLDRTRYSSKVGGRSSGKGTKGTSIGSVQLSSGSGLDAFISLNTEAGTTDNLTYNTGVTRNQIINHTPDYRTAVGILKAAAADKLGNLIIEFYTKKLKYWDALKGVVTEEILSADLTGRIDQGITNRVVNHRYKKQKHWVGSPIYPVLGISGDDPVHIAIRKNRNDSEEDSGRYSQEQANKAYEERERLVGFLATPDIWMCAPPKCNVVFPEEVISLNISRELMRQTSRVMLMTYDKLLADNVILNSHYFAPQFQDVESIAQTSFGNSTSHEVVYPHEKYSGIIPKVQRRSELSFYSRASQGAASEKQVSKDLANKLKNQSYDTQYAEIAKIATKGIAENVRSYGSNVAHFELLKQRYSSTRISVTSKFLPRLVPSLPGVVIGKQVVGRDFRDTHTWLGMVESVQHTYSQAGATTSFTLSTCRPYDTGKNSIDELASLKLSGRNLFLNQDPANITEASSGDVASRTPLLSFHHQDVFLPANLYGKSVAGPTLDVLPSEVVRLLQGQNSLKDDTLFGVPVDSSADNPTRMIRELLLDSIELFERYAGNTARTLPAAFGKPTVRKRTEDYAKTYKGPTGSTTISTKTRTVKAEMKGTTRNSLPFTAISFYEFKTDTSSKSKAVTGNIDIDMTDPIKDLLVNMGYNTSLGIVTEEGTATAVEKANGTAETIEALVGNNNSFLVKTGNTDNRIQSVTTNPVTSPVLGYIYLTGEWVLNNYKATENLRSERETSLKNGGFVARVEATDIGFDSDSIVDPEQMALFANVVTEYNPVTESQSITVQIPVVFRASQFTLQISDSPPTESTTGEKLIPLEESLMPPWIDAAYKNGIVNETSKKIDKSTGIGRLYRQWFDCDSILDDVAYAPTSIYYTVTIEESIKKLITTYSSGKLEPVYKWSDRNIATLHDMLEDVNPEHRKTNDVFQSGGFHSTAVGPYEKLEGLGLIGQQLRGNVIVTSTVTIPDTIVSLDPRAERRKRVKIYRDYIVATRGKIG